VLRIAIVSAGRVWCAAIVVACLLELVAPRLSPLPLLAYAQVGPRWLEVPALLVLGVAAAGCRWAPTRWALPIKLAVVPGAALCVVEGIAMFAGHGWNAEATPFRTGWHLLILGTVPPSFACAATGALVIWNGRCAQALSRAKQLTAHAAACVVVLALIGNVVLFHASVRDARRPPTVIVVFGAGVRIDGTPTHALRDRVETAVALARAFPAAEVRMTGYVSRGQSEVEVMRDLAIAGGIDASRISLDREGPDTRSSFRNLRAWLARSGRLAQPVAVVSSGHHLARLRLLCRRAELTCDAVPASRPLPGEPYFVGREIAALVYYGLFVDVVER
jgi:uncharacterized SAM-binding protein YcdF (DUF218 family)